MPAEMCSWKNCSLRASMNMGDGWLCSWHQEVVTEAKSKNPINNEYNFEQWRQARANRMPDEDQRQSHLRHYTWARVTGGK